MKKCEDLQAPSHHTAAALHDLGAAATDQNRQSPRVVFKTGQRRSHSTALFLFPLKKRYQKDSVWNYYMEYYGRGSLQRLHPERPIRLEEKGSLNITAIYSHSMSNPFFSLVVLPSDTFKTGRFLRAPYDHASSHGPLKGGSLSSMKTT